MDIKERLLTFATSLDVDCFDVLDEMVHDLKAEEATVINNQGIESQLAYIAQSGVSLEEVLNAIRDEAEEEMEIRNFYRCGSCSEEWDSEWICEIPEHCPACGTLTSPYDLEEFGVEERECVPGD